MGYVQADGTVFWLGDLGVDDGFHACRSNAALHWMTLQDAVLRNVRAVLVAGGRFVAEMGGDGNTADMDAALCRARPISGWRASRCPGTTSRPSANRPQRWGSRHPRRTGDLVPQAHSRGARIHPRGLDRSGAPHATTLACSDDLRRGPVVLPAPGAGGSFECLDFVGGHGEGQGAGVGLGLVRVLGAGDG